MDQVTASGDMDRVIELFKALAHPIRSRIVATLIESPADVGTLTDAVGTASQPLVSHHLKILRNCHLVEVQRIGRTNQYSLIDDHVASIFLDAWNHTREHDNDCEH